MLQFLAKRPTVSGVQVVVVPVVLSYRGPKIDLRGFVSRLKAVDSRDDEGRSFGGQ